jgi:hypothetical protein
VGGVGMKGFTIKTFTVDFISLEHNPGDFALVDQFEEFGIAELGFFFGKLRPIKKVKKHGHYQANKQPKGNIFIKGAKTIIVHFYLRGIGLPYGYNFYHIVSQFATKAR